jgi:hypothetical protein
MAINRNPYLKHIDSYKDTSLAIYSLTKTIGLRDDQVDPIYLTTDGKIIANGFVDKNDNIELYLDETLNLSYKRKLDAVTSEKYQSSFTKSYIKTGVAFEALTNDFTFFEKPINYYTNKDRVKYNNLNKTTKKLVDGQNSGPFVFTFTHENGNKYPLPHIEGTWLPAYNYDVYLSPTDLLEGTNDIIVIKSGEFKSEPQTPTINLIELLYYSSGTSGNIYMDTLSIPDHAQSTYLNLETTLNSVKIPRTGNSNYGVGATKEATAPGPIGVFKNGVFAFSYKSKNEWTGAGSYIENSQVANYDVRDTCGGQAALGSDIASGQLAVGTYHYKSAPICLYETSSTDHSPLLGYAFDGNPIYGPYGYTTALDSSSTPKLMAPSWRLKQISNRTNGPDYDLINYPSGYFQEDYEYVSGLGDLDRYNGRTCITPEYPGGVYAYFTTVDSDHEPVFPYIVGDSFYGKVEKQNWSGVSVTEPVSLVTGKDLLPAADFDVDLYTENVYGIKNTKNAGLNKETIIWVSPHELSSYTGVCLATGTYQYLGATGQNASFSGNLFTATGNQTRGSHTSKFIAESKGFSYPTSKDYTFVGKGPFSGGMTYIRTDQDTLTEQQVTGYTDLGTTNFYTIYSGYKNGIEGIKSGSKNPNFETGVWDGVIPSGVPFKIEVWSFNGSLCGFQNRVSVYPVQDNDAVTNKTLFMQNTFTGVGSSTLSAQENMVENAKNYFLKEIDSYLMMSGIRPVSSKLQKYANMIQNGVST